MSIIQFVANVIFIVIAVYGGSFSLVKLIETKDKRYLIMSIFAFLLFIIQLTDIVIAILL